MSHSSAALAPANHATSTHEHHAASWFNGYTQCVPTNASITLTSGATTNNTFASASDASNSARAIYNATTLALKYVNEMPMPIVAANSPARAAHPPI